MAINPYPARNRFFCISAYKIAYLPINKCATTSIANFIAGLKTDHIARPLWAEQNHGNNFDHVTSAEEELKHYFTFTFVRNPYDRFLSFYNNWINSPPPRRRVFEHYEQLGFRAGMPFKECVERLVAIKDPGLLDAHTAPMFMFIYRKNRQRARFVGKVETIRKDFDYIARQCSIDHRLAHLNRTPKTDGNKNPYTTELRELIYRFYRKDFILFNYPKKPETASFLHAIIRRVDTWRMKIRWRRTIP